MAGALVRRIGITGTDTGVGKTIVACALLALLRDRGHRTAAMKPVETGVSPQDRDTDGHRLVSLATSAAPMMTASPYRLREPLAPLAAAELEGESIDPRRLDAAFHELSADVDAVVVEGAGGILVPVTASLSMLDLFRRWSLEMLIVAPNRLGVINHVLLTERAAHSAGLVLTAVVLVDPAEADESTAGNGALLARLTPAPVLRFPRLRDPADPRELAAGAAAAGLDVLFHDLMPTTPLA
jgi:dethiobiotin synthetase